MTDSQSANLSWCQAASGAKNQIFVAVKQLQVSSCEAPCLTRGWVFRLQFLLALASSAILMAFRISSTYHLYLKLYMCAFCIVVKSLVPCGHLIFTVLHLTLVCYSNISNSHQPTEERHSGFCVCSALNKDICTHYHCEKCDVDRSMTLYFREYLSKLNFGSNFCFIFLLLIVLEKPVIFKMRSHC